MENIDDWPDLIARQCGIVSRQQLRDHGFTAGTIRAHVAAGRWTGLQIGVYATFTGPLSPEARRWAAVLACWPCALSHDTAAVVLGLRRPGSDDGPVQVTRPYGLPAARADGVEVHRSRAFAHLTVPGSDPPVVSAPYTAVDLAVAEPTARMAMSTTLDLLVTTALTPDELRKVIDVRPPRRMRQFPVTVDDVGRNEDVLYRYGDREAIVRLDGRRYHAVQSVTLTDRRRANAAELAGRSHLVYGWPEVTGTPCRAAREVATVLGCGLRPCERCRSS